MGRLAAWRKQMWLILMVKINGCGYPSPPLNLTKDQLNELTTSMVLDMRLSLDTYFDATGITGREIYRLATLFACI